LTHRKASICTGLHSTEESEHISTHLVGF